MKKLILLVLFISTTAHAGWYCDKVASEWTDPGKILKACGIGKGEDENTARLSAYNNARKEFDLVCNKDTSCANKVINIDPQRTECTSGDRGFTCHRLFFYHVTDEDRETTPQVDKKDFEPKVINNYNNVYNNYITIKTAKDHDNSDSNNYKPKSFRSFIRQSGRVTVYSTNSREYQGVYLTNPTEEEIEREITRGNRSGGVNTVYLYNP